MSEHDDEGLPVVLSEDATELMRDPALPGDVFGAIVAATVQINQARGMVPGSTASVRWPQQRRMVLGEGGVLGVAEYVIVEDADPPHIVLTRIQLY